MVIRFHTFQAAVTSVTSCKVLYDDGVLTIHGYNRGGSRIFQIQFDSVVFVTVADESTRLGLFHLFNQNRPDLIMIDEESGLIEWLKKEGLGTRDFGGAKHFIVTSGEEIIDVISFSSPITTLTGAV